MVESAQSIAAPRKIELQLTSHVISFMGGPYTVLNMAAPRRFASLQLFGLPGVVGIPGGGTSGQILGKLSDDDFDIGWVVDQTGGGGGGVTDGDKGDIVVSGGGTVWSIDGAVLTAFGRSLINDADAATARTTLGLGTLATQSGTFSGTSSGANTGDETAAGILAKLITVDGAGSGLDADLLDGNSSAFFATAAQFSTLMAGVSASFDTLLEIETALGGKAATVHTHAQADVTNLVADLAGKQPLDADLTTIAGLTATSDNFMQAKAGAWASRTVAQVKTDLNLAGTNSGDQTITLTGDVTGSGTGSFAATIAANAVTNAKMATMATLTIKGNNTGGASVPIDLTASQVKTLLAIAQADVAGLTTADSPQFAGVNIGHASDTTITRPAAGQLAVEGKRIFNDGDKGVIGCVIDGGGAAITTGIKGDIGPMTFAGEFEDVTLLADQSGSIVIDIWKDAYANFPPTVADTITASAKPTISAATKSQDATLTGWTKTFAIGDIFRLNVDSAATIQKVTVSMKVKRT